MTPGSTSERISIRIETDGVPSLLGGSNKLKSLPSLIMKSAPFNLPPAGKPLVLDIELDPAQGKVRVHFIKQPDSQ